MTEEKPKYERPRCPRCNSGQVRIGALDVQYHYEEETYSQILRCQRCGFSVDLFEGKEKEGAGTGTTST